MTQIKLLTKSQDPTIIGFIQELSIIENKANQYPKLEATRIRFDKSKITEVFDRGFVHAAAQKYPLQIIITENDKQIILIDNVWVSAISTSYNSDNFIVSEGIEFDGEKTFITNTFCCTN